MQRSALLRGPRLAGRNGVGSATIGGLCRNFSSPREDNEVASLTGRRVREERTGAEPAGGSSHRRRHPGSPRRWNNTRMAGADLGLIAKFRQEHLSGALRELERAPPTLVELKQLASLPDERKRVAFLAADFESHVEERQPGRADRHPAHRRGLLFVKGTDTDDLKSGPGVYPETRFPGIAGTTAIADIARPISRPFATSTRSYPAITSCSRCPTRALPIRSSDTGWWNPRTSPPRSARSATRVSCLGVHSVVQRRQTAARLRDADADGPRRRGQATARSAAHPTDRSAGSAGRGGLSPSGAQTPQEEPVVPVRLRTRRRVGRREPCRSR